jgi:ABC-2 type transport system ATP-binding protein
MLTIEDLSVRHARRRDLVLRQFNLHINAGECCALVGPSGAGKTALLEAIIGMRPLHAGRITVDSASSESLPSDRRHSVTAIWSPAAIDGTLTVRQAVSLILNLAGAAQPSPLTMTQVFRAVDLPDRALDQPASGLSGAQRFSVWLAIARLRHTPILLLDDPTAAWSASEVANAASLIGDLRALGVTIILATRDTGLASSVADVVVVMEEGRKLTEGSPRVVFGGGFSGPLLPAGAEP